MNRIQNLRVAIVPKEVMCQELTGQNAEMFYTASSYNIPVLKEVVGEFENALKEEVGLTGKVKKTTKKELNRGSIDFTVTATPTSNPSYQSVGIRIEQYLTDIQQLNEEGMKREGVRTIDGTPYIRLDDIAGKVDNLIEQYKNPSQRITIGYSQMRKDADIERMLDLEPGTFGKVTGENAKTYRIAKEQTKLLGKNVVTPFKNALKTATGYSKDNVPDETKVDMFGIGNYVFMVGSAPREEIKYGDAAKEFIELLEEPEGFARTREGNLYVPVGVLQEKYGDIVQDRTRTTVQQDIKVMPEPKYDNVFVV